MTKLTLEEFKKRFPNGGKCSVTYGNGKNKKIVDYDNFIHINWNSVTKITLKTNPKVVWCEKASENVTRDGKAFKIV